jgi:hypothetical protein
VTATLHSDSGDGASDSQRELSDLVLDCLLSLPLVRIRRRSPRLPRIDPAPPQSFPSSSRAAVVGRRGRSPALLSLSVMCVTPHARSPPHRLPTPKAPTLGETRVRRRRPSGAVVARRHRRGHAVTRDRWRRIRKTGRGLHCVPRCHARPRLRPGRLAAGEAQAARQAAACAWTLVGGSLEARPADR